MLALLCLLCACMSSSGENSSSPATMAAPSLLLPSPVISALWMALQTNCASGGSQDKVALLHAARYVAATAASRAAAGGAAAKAGSPLEAIKSSCVALIAASVLQGIQQVRNIAARSLLGLTPGATAPAACTCGLIDASQHSTACTLFLETTAGTPAVPKQEPEPAAGIVRGLVIDIALACSHQPAALSSMLPGAVVALALLVTGTQNPSSTVAGASKAGLAAIEAAAVAGMKALSSLALSLATASSSPSSLLTSLAAPLISALLPLSPAREAERSSAEAAVCSPIAHVLDDLASLAAPARATFVKTLVSECILPWEEGCSRASTPGSCMSFLAARLSPAPSLASLPQMLAARSSVPSKPDECVAAAVDACEAWLVTSASILSCLHTALKAGSDVPHHTTRVGATGLRIALQLANDLSVGCAVVSEDASQGPDAWAGMDASMQKACNTAAAAVASVLAASAGAMESALAASAEDASGADDLLASRRGRFIHATVSSLWPFLSPVLISKDTLGTPGSAAFGWYDTRWLTPQTCSAVGQVVMTIAKSSPPRFKAVLASMPATQRTAIEGGLRAAVSGAHSVLAVPLHFVARSALSGPLLRRAAAATSVSAASTAAAPTIAPSVTPHGSATTAAPAAQASARVPAASSASAPAPAKSLLKFDTSKFKSTTAATPAKPAAPAPAPSSLLAAFLAGEDGEADLQVGVRARAEASDSDDE